MATMAETIHQSRRTMKSRNIALGSIFGVIGGTVLMFRFLAPQRDRIVSNEEVATYRGGDSAQTARSPRK